MLAVVALIAAALLIDAGVRAGIADLLLLAPWLLLMVWGAYVASFASHIRVDTSGVSVQNFLRRTWIPWRDVTDVVLRWQLEFVLTDGSKITGMGGPAVGAIARTRGGGRGERDAEVVREFWRRADDLADAPQKSRSWDVPAIVALAVILVWAAIAILVAGSPA
nr:PH domain-containing protein [Microbacterium endophyticum]